MFNFIKKFFPKNKSEDISKLLFGILGASIGILLSIVIVQLNNIEKAYQNLARVEHLNANVQRLAKLAILELDTTTTLHYLDVEIFNLFDNSDHAMISNDKYVVYEVASDLVREWGLLKNLILEEDKNNEIYLLSDNFHFKSNELMTYIQAEINALSRLVFVIHTVLSLISVFAALLCLSRILAIKTEHEHLKELNEFSMIDISTGLYNRSKCQELFKRNNTANPNVNNAIVVFDLNDLKKANDNHGHQIGDELINTFANLLTQSTRIHDVRPFIGRYGGDEFIVYYDYLQNPKDIKYLLFELKSLTEQFNLTKDEYQVSYAVGFAINSEKESHTIRKLFDKADAYMYTNKVNVKEGIKIEYPNIEEDEIDGIKREKTFTPVSSELERAFPALPDEASIENRRKQSLKHNKRVIAMSTIILFAIGGIASLHDKVGKDVIDNNIFYLSDNSTRSPEDKIVGSPWRNASLASNLLFRTIFSTDSTFQQINPNLAQEFEILDDGLAYKITLKPNEYWSDGTPITMDDIVFSIETFLLASNTNTNIATAFNKIVGAENFKKGITNSLEGLSVDGQSLTIKLDNKYNLFLSMLTQFTPLPKHILEDVDHELITGEIDYYANPITSGMYVVSGLNDDGNMVLSHNPHYNGKTPNIDNVVLVSNYTPLDIDFYSTNVMSDVIDYRSIKDFDEYAIDVHFYRYFVYNIQGMEGSDEYNPISDKRVREALMYAIDRQYLLDIIYLNMGKILAEEDEQGFSEQDYQYSPNKARSLLEEADYDFDRPIKIMYYYGDDISYMFLEKVAEYYEDIGLKVELIKSSGPNEMYEIRDYDIMLKGLSSFNEYDWYNEYISTNQNLSKIYGTDVFDQLVDELFSTNDFQEYNSILDDLKKIEQELIYKMPLYTFDQYVFLNTNKVKIPNNVSFANTSYRYDIKFEDWTINKG